MNTVFRWAIIFSGPVFGRCGRSRGLPGSTDLIDHPFNSKEKLQS